MEEAKKLIFHRPFLYFKTVWSRSFAVILGIILLFSVAIRLSVLNNFRMGFDEGVHLLWAQLLASGYKPYTEVFIGYPPLFPEGLALAWRLMHTINALRAAMVIWNSLSLAAVAMVAKELSGHKAGIGAALLLSLAPYHILYSRAVLADLPAISLATVAIWLGVRYVLSGRLPWLLMAGVAFGASLLIKPLFPFGILVLGTLMAEKYLPVLTAGSVKDHSAKWLIGRDVGLLVAGVVLPWAIAFFVYDPVALYDQAIAFRIAVRGGHPLDLSGKLQQVWSLILDNPGLMLLAGYGVIRLSRLPRYRWGVAMWLGTAVFTLFYQRPLWEHHLAVLLPPLVLLGGIGIGDLVKQIAGQSKRHGAAMAAGGLAIYLALLPFSLATLYDKKWQPASVAGRGEMVTFIKHITSPDDCIITDDPAIALGADLLVPPSLAETSEVRFGNGYLTRTELIAIAREADCPAVVFSSSRDTFREYFPDFLDWVQTHYLIHLSYSRDHLYFVKRDVHVSPSLTVTNLGGQIKLYADGLKNDFWKTGQSVPVRLLWEAQSPVSTDYKVFAHLRDAQNQTVAQADHQPFAGLLPTSAWPAGEVIAETFWLSLPDDLPTGPYRLLVGLYHPETGERLPVANDVTGENAVTLGTLNIKPP